MICNSAKKPTKNINSSHNTQNTNTDQINKCLSKNMHGYMSIPYTYKYRRVHHSYVALTKIYLVENARGVNMNFIFVKQTNSNISYFLPMFPYVNFVTELFHFFEMIACFHCEYSALPNI